jgi:hypothetical protein
MTITVELFASGPQTKEFFESWIEAKSRAQYLANKHGAYYALFDEDHNLEDVIPPERGPPIMRPFPTPERFQQLDDTIFGPGDRALVMIDPLGDLTPREVEKMTAAVLALPLYYDLLIEVAEEVDGKLNAELIERIKEALKR